jgi:hypothetical protein
MALLDSQFDRGTGQPRQSPDPDEIPARSVHVALIDSQRPADQRRGRSPRPQLESIENELWNISRRVEGDRASDSALRHTHAYVPRSVDLDPTAALTSRAARVDRLIRAVLNLAGSLQDPKLESIIQRAALRQIPAANRAIVREAREVLNSWANLPPWTDQSPPIRSCHIPFTYTWPTEPTGVIVFHGMCDLVETGLGFPSRLIQLASARVPLATEKLRLQLAALALAENTTEPIDIQEAWLLRYDTENRTKFELVKQLDRSAAASAVAAWLEVAT